MSSLIAFYLSFGDSFSPSLEFAKLAGWPMSSRNPLVSASPGLGHGLARLRTNFKMGAAHANSSPQAYVGSTY